MVCTKEGLVVWLVRAALSVGGQARGLLRALGCKCARTLPRGGSVSACGSVLADACSFYAGVLTHMHCHAAFLARLHVAVCVRGVFLLMRGS